MTESQRIRKEKQIVPDEDLERDNTPEKNRNRVAKQLNVEAYDKVRKSLEGMPIGTPLNPRIPTDTLPYITRTDWKQFGKISGLIVLEEALPDVPEFEEAPTEVDLELLELREEIDGDQ